MPPDGWFYLGMYATPNYNNPPSPSGPIWVVQSSETSDTDEDPPLAPPSLLVQTWTCVDGDQSSNLGIYSLVAPPGYIALGSIAVPDFKSPPDPDDYPELMCVRQDLCTQVTVESGNVVWTDKGSKAPLDVTVWLLRGPNMLCGGEPVGRLSGVLSGLGSQGRAQPDPALRRTVMATIPSAAGIRQGRFEVDANGQATYVLPIEVPPGIAGAHPRLGLAYGHHQGNGVVGVGWSLAGLSAITRSKATWDVDGFNGCIDYGPDDRYVLDGQRLIAVDGQYGQPGTVYYAEVHDWSKAVAGQTRWMASSSI